MSTQYIYVCHFSNGHIKVGRSISPKSRIASHADRVACVGIELVEYHIVECVGHSAPAESVLIRQCSALSTKRNKSEWFEGLDYLDVCEIANQAATTLVENIVENIVVHDFKTFYLSMSPDDREAFAASTGTSTGMLTQIAYGHKQIELGFADVLVAKGHGYGLDTLPLTDRAKDQHRIRCEDLRPDVPWGVLHGTAAPEQKEAA